MKASSKATVCKLYEDSAEGYSKMMDSEIKLPIYSDILGRLKERLVTITGPVVDTSCGSGHMLSMYYDTYDSGRALIGVDLSPAMIGISNKRLKNRAEILMADMCQLENIEADSSAAILNFFAIHHLDPADCILAFKQWFRVLTAGGQLIIAAWEGNGVIDYEGESDIVAFRYTKKKVVEFAQQAGFFVDRCQVEPVEDFTMDAVYLEATKP